MILRGQDSKVLRGVSGEVLTEQDSNLILKMKWNFGVDKTGSDVNSIQNQWHKSTRLIPVNLKPTENGDGIFFNSYQNALKFAYPLLDFSNVKIKAVYKIPTGSANGEIFWANENVNNLANRIGIGFEANSLKYWQNNGPAAIVGSYSEPKDVERRIMLSPIILDPGGPSIYLYQIESQLNDIANRLLGSLTSTQPLPRVNVGGLPLLNFGTSIHIYYLEISINNVLKTLEEGFNEWAEFRDKPLSEL